MKKAKESAKNKTHVQNPAINEENMKERRKFMRFSTPLNVEYRTLTLNPIFGKTLAKDLSREGLRVGLKEQVSVGTPVEISMNVPGDNLPVFATGKVAWADGLEAGIRLTKIEQTDRMRVLEYVYKEWLKSARKSTSA